MPPSPRGQEHVSEFPAVQIRESAEIIQLLPNCQRHSASDRHQSHEPLIVPSGFEIQRLPLEVESFAFSIMQTIARSWSQKGNHHTNETTDIGDAGGLSSGPFLSSVPITIWHRYWHSAKTCRSVHSYGGTPTLCQNRSIDRRVFLHPMPSFFPQCDRLHNFTS